MTKNFILTLFLLILLSVSSKAQPINPPTELQADPEDSSYIKLRWHDNSNNEQGFYIEKSLINSSQYWEVIDTVAQNAISYFDYWVTRGRTYYYRVRAYNGPVTSDYSNIDSAVLLGNPNVIPTAPSNLIVTDTSMTSIRINWTDNSSNENGFIIARKSQQDLFFHYIDSVGTDILTYQEVGLTPDNVYFYKVCAFNSSGISDYTNTISAHTEQNTMIINYSTELPDKYFLANNYPNPFNPVTNIKFGITNNTFVRITIYNSLGSQVEILMSQNLRAGIYHVTWDALNYTSGLYFYRIETKDFTETKKMILIK